MMNYEIFKEVVKEKFMDYMPEKFKGVELVAEPVEKVNVTLRVLFSLAFGKEYVSVELEKENKYEVSGKNFLI